MESILTGKKVYLRHPRLEDFPEFLKLVRNSRKLHRGLVSPPETPETFGEYVSRNELETDRALLICTMGDNKVVGAINLSQIFRKAFQNCYLGYYIGAEHANSGLMTEAVGLSLKYAFGDLKLHRVEANVQPENRASIRVLEKNGFSKEGYSRRYLKIAGKWRDHERWAILSEDWKKFRQ